MTIGLIFIAMKKISISFYLLSLLFISSCISDELLQDTSNITPDGDIRKVTAILPEWSLDSGESRTSITTGPYPTAPSPVWVTGDSIGIYPDAGGDQLSFRINEGGSKICTFDGGGWAMKSSSYTAYSPFERNYYYKDKNALPINMLGQVQNGNDNADHLGAYDIQIAKGEKPETGNLIFEFSRKVALVRMELKAPRAASWTSVSLESNAFFTTESKMNLSLSIPTVTEVTKSNIVTLGLNNVATTSDNQEIIAYMMLLPVDLTGKTLIVKLQDNEGNVYSSEALVVNNKTNFAANGARWITADNFKLPGISVHVNTAGSLSSLISDTDKYSIATLTVTGNINSDDISFIRAMAGFNNDGAKTNGKLVQLDLSGCNIVSGGSGYYSYNADYVNLDGTESLDGYGSYNTLDNTLPGCMFAKTNMKSFILPSSITAIDKAAFFGSKLKSVTIPASVRNIKDTYQSYCNPFSHSEIENIYVADNHPTFVSIDGIIYDKQSMQLLYCPGGKKSVNIPEGVTSIGGYAFCGTLYLTNTDFLEKVVVDATTESRHFYRSGISSAKIPEGWTDIPTDMFYKCYNLSSVVIPEGVKRIRAGNFAFSALEIVVLPSTVSEIDTDAFSNISTLKEVHFKATTPPWYTGSAVFGGTINSKANCILYVPKGSLDAYKQADVWKDFMEIKEE